MKVLFSFLLFFILVNDSAGAPMATSHTVQGTGRPIAVDLLPPGPINGKQQQRIAYLTFDDGPSTNTKAILDILDRYEIKATFFVMGHEEPYAMKGYKEIKNRGHVIALHCFSHDYSVIYRSKEGYFKDLNRLEVFLKKNFGITSNVVRFPGGSKNITTRQAATKHVVPDIINELTKRGYIYYDWTIDSRDGDSPYVSKQAIIQNVLKEAAHQQQAVILLHDINSMKNTVRALPDIIEGLKSQGFIFDIIDDYSPKVHL
ncbi:polysaccharide deacetylase family protein [Peribacillus glennii]|uniref:Polysaccharide deacetylase n=1 Tax=Peribacillus glennii TaxID=2303991 RepID=A0A372LHG1_9BACI|nr:polysaccharide deacetylase family protein [Peribacillus glennii]RFU65392.1 polysaccharide deacetylase [Peribacillus glennii]